MISAVQLRRQAESAVRTVPGSVMSSRMPSASLRDCRRDAARIQPPHRAGADIRKPHRAVSNADSIAAFTRELLHDFSQRGIDPGNRKLERRDPNRTFTECYLASGARHTDLDRLNYLVCFRIDFRYITARLIQRPNKAAADSQEARGFPHRDRFHHKIRFRIYSRQYIGRGPGNPNRTFAKGDRE